MHLIIHSTAVHLCVLYFSQCVGSHVSETPVSIASVHIIEPFEGGGGAVYYCNYCNTRAHGIPPGRSTLATSAPAP